ncbi:hypothetical protein Q1695_004157 [Nippostrongylus brasiliensis]|nr:hypothetical protein Q1695_004157 [Nippostrongylus brasiliensis]
MGDSSSSGIEESVIAAGEARRGIRRTLLCGAGLFCVFVVFTIALTIYVTSDAKRDYPVESLHMLDRHNKPIVKPPFYADPFEDGRW